MKAIRPLDFVFSLTGLIVLSPLFLLVALLVKLTSKGPVFYLQNRVGKGGRDFRVYKFRTMYTDADKKGLLTVGGKDKRVTNVGYYLRRFKLDELPQLLNVLAGDMSIVGPRPEVRRYVDLYTTEQRKVLSVRPGITDYASIAYRNENDLLATAANPEEMYIREIMPKKIDLNFNYINNRSIKTYFTIIIKTLSTSVKGNN
jgi:lipopolysaccharide/colanic/teichoic acid biosynthesis glycosyltransferase